LIALWIRCSALRSFTAGLTAPVYCFAENPACESVPMICQLRPVAGGGGCVHRIAVQFAIDEAMAGLRHEPANQLSVWCP
jgi:hypothetical protein